MMMLIDVQKRYTVNLAIPLKATFCCEEEFSIQKISVNTFVHQKLSTAFNVCTLTTYDYQSALSNRKRERVTKATQFLTSAARPTQSTTVKGTAQSRKNIDIRAQLVTKRVATMKKVPVKGLNTYLTCTADEGGQYHTINE